MAATPRTARLAPYAQELLDNDYVRQNLRDGVDQLRAAYRRSRKRRVEPTRDERVRRQLQSAARSIGEAGSALRSGRRKPKPRWGTRLAVLAGLGVAGAAAAAWASERLGSQTPQSGSTDGQSGRDPIDQAAEPATV